MSSTPPDKSSQSSDEEFGEQRKDTIAADCGAPNAAQTDAQILKSRKFGKKEEGAAEPTTPPLKREITVGKLLAKWGKPPQKYGWPKLTKEAYGSFRDEPEPVKVTGPVTLYRVIGDDNFPNGSYWSLEPPTTTEAEWRSRFAISNDFNGNGGYVTYEIGKDETVRAWQGPIRAQQSADGASALAGGAQQIYIEFNTATCSEVFPTGWN